jgi:hypothetical protein
LEQESGGYVLRMKIWWRTCKSLCAGIFWNLGEVDIGFMRMRIANFQEEAVPISNRCVVLDDVERLCCVVVHPVMSQTGPSPLSFVEPLLYELECGIFVD